MKILTWNIDNSEIEIQKRMELLKMVLNLENPDIICLQEVTKSGYNYLVKNTDYKYTDYNNEVSYTTIIGINPEISHTKTIIKLESSMNREAIWFKLKDFDLVTFHLESGPLNSEIRKIQIKQILDNTFSDKVIMCGDTNFILNHESFDNSYIDYSPEDPSYNYLENKRILGPYISYLDRVFSKNVELESFLVKNDEISDHFGIIFTKIINPYT